YLRGRSVLSRARGVQTRRIGRDVLPALSGGQRRRPAVSENGNWRAGTRRSGGSDHRGRRTAVVVSAVVERVLESTVVNYMGKNRYAWKRAISSKWRCSARATWATASPKSSRWVATT